MRGKVGRLLLGGQALGITPAYAGKSIFQPSVYEVDGDHPRICGEKVMAPRRYEVGGGSPPHMRGKGQFHTGVIAMTGITPAYAGKRRRRCRRACRWRDHPRICGEKQDIEVCETKEEGSPPHMRGKETKFLSGGMAERITPAYAGKVANSGGGRVLCGITPAYAGKSLFANSRNGAF